jgi:hypothetical protein
MESTSSWQQTMAKTHHTPKVTTLQVKPSKMMEEDYISNHEN